MNSHDYPSIIAQNTIDFATVIGKTLQAVWVEVAQHEINQAYLHIAGQWYSVHGLVGSEVLGFCACPDAAPELGVNSQGYGVVRLPLTDAFVGMTIAAVHAIGAPWCGHGFEIFFQETYEKTLILQSIYSANTPQGFEDCMRIGVGNYLHDVSEYSRVGR